MRYLLIALCFLTFGALTAAQNTGQAPNLNPTVTPDHIDAYPGANPNAIVPPGQPGQASPDLMPEVPTGPEGSYEKPPAPRRYWWRGGERNYPEDEARLRLYVGSYYNFASTGYSTNGSLYTTGFNGPTAFSVDTATAPGFNAEVFMARPYSIGFDAGVDYDLTRSVNDFNSNAASTYYSGTRPTLQFTSVYGNGVFRWWNGYIPIGINYLIPTFTGGVGNGAIVNTNFVGNVGFQFGLGFLIGRQFAVELLDRILHFQASSSANNTQVNWGDTYFSGLQINLKFSFL